MHESEPKNFQTFWSAHFVAELYASGLRHVVISPGSRSTPLTLAFAQHPGIKKHVVLDERSAAYIALGIGMQSGKPAALVCTSGTAAANYFPAVVEARMSGIPMIALTADRPPFEREIGANQAIDQLNLFGNKAVFFADAGEARNEGKDLRRLKILADQAWAQSIETGGCSHINLPFRKPLEPDNNFLVHLKNWYERYLKDQPLSLSDKSAARIAVGDHVISLLKEAKRPVVVCGPSQLRAPLTKLIHAFSRQGIPVLAEAGSLSMHLKPDIIEQHEKSFIPGFNSFLRREPARADLEPDLIIRIGDEPVGKGIELYLKHCSHVKSIHLAAGHRPGNTAMLPQIRVNAANGEFDPQIVAGMFEDIEIDWLPRWTNYGRKFLDHRELVMRPADDFRDGDVHYALAKFIPPHYDIMVSNSFPVRDIDLFAMPQLAGRNIYMNRGASGIDGITSTALGIAKSSGKPLVLVTGDLAFLHDMNALLSLDQESGIDLLIIVVNNNGGSIFRMLPASDIEDLFQTYFETPQRAEIKTLCEAMGIPCVQVRSSGELEDNLKPTGFSGYRVIECITNPEISMIQRHQLWGN